jgi:SAM-dependent methyltransferase
MARKIKEAFGSIRGLRTVELGAGRGDMSYLLATAGARVTLVDNSAVALRQSKALFEAHGLSGDFVLANLFEMSIQDRFDVSMSFGVLEHFRGAKRGQIVKLHAIAEVAFVSVPNALCVPYRAWKFALELTNRWQYGEESPLTAQGLKEEMLRSFKQVVIFHVPLNFHLNRFIGRPTFPTLPFDGALAYQLVACGRLPK